MDINIRKEIGRCHQCGHEYLILTRKIEYPKGLKVPVTPTCPECSSEDIVLFSTKKTFVNVPEDNLTDLSKTLLHDISCVKCGKFLPLLSGERVELIFEMGKVVNEAEGLVKEWRLSAPFYKYCMEHESEDSLIDASQKYFKNEDEESTEELLKKAIRGWKY